MPNLPLVSIIDDDESALTATNNLVRSLGLRTYAFGSAEDFLESRCLQETSCLITDVKMPGTSGVELQRSLMTLADPPPVIFVTAFPDEGLRARVIRDGAIAYLRKPLDGKTLMEHLSAALERARPTVE